MLLTRENFKKEVFKRDNHKCVVCGKPAVDAHHIMDRKLFVWNDEKNGYFLDNGVSVCEEHHIDAEKTIISCQELRDMAKIKNIIYPKNLFLTEFVKDYDKWGNPILKSGKRLKGNDFYKDNVQKIIKDKLELFENDMHIATTKKYPRTYHLPFSPGTTNDDRVANNFNQILSGETVWSEKLDGENSSILGGDIFARSRTAPTQNPWSTWLKQKGNLIKNDLDDLGIMICGENTYAEHSIKYSGLDEHFHVFGVKDLERDIWLSWEEVEYYSYMFDFKTVPVLFKTDKDWIGTEKEVENKIIEMMSKPSTYNNNEIWTTPKEGIVIRRACEFNNDMFYNNIYKYVRKGHVQTDEHWSKNWKKAKLKRDFK